MLSLQQIESDLTVAIKARDQIAADTLRGLKTRLQNGRIAKQRELAESDILALVRSELKRRQDAAELYRRGGRVELAGKELSEAGILRKYLPAQMSERQIGPIIDGIIRETNAVSADFGKLMGKLKAQLGDTADGATLAKLLKEKLK